MFRLNQNHLDLAGLSELEAALQAQEAVDASRLKFTKRRINQIRQMLSEPSSGRPLFSKWNFAGSKFEEESDFSFCDFSQTNCDRCSFGSRTSFRGATFRRSPFRDARIGDEVSFERVEFGSKADFHSAWFGNRVRFSHSTFQATQFFGAIFGEEASFARATFAFTARFHSARFGDRANFTDATFASGADFGGAFFGEKAQMAKATFKGNPKFVGTSFGARARLTDWTVEGDLDMRSAHFAGAVSLHGAVVEGHATLSFASFEGFVDIGQVVTRGKMNLDGVTIYGADRFGPIHAGEELVLRDALVRSACAFTLGATVVDLSGTRFLAPTRVAIAGGDVKMDRLQNSSRLLVTTPQPVGVITTPPRLLSVRGADLNDVVLSGLDVRCLRLKGAEGIDNLRIETGAEFEPAPRGMRAHREVIAEEHALRKARSSKKVGWFPAACQFKDEATLRSVNPAELARIYRSLRKAREDMRDAPGAADFYYGEMEMRRLEARQRLTAWRGAGPLFLNGGTYVLLELYRLCGGYGVRPSRPLLLFLVLAVVGAAWVDGGDLIHRLVSGQSDQPDLVDATFNQCLVFVIRSALLLPTGGSIVASTGGEWVQVAARILGPLLIGLFAFGMRARVHR